MGVGAERGREAFVAGDNTGSLGSKGVACCAPAKDTWRMANVKRAPSFFVSIADKGLKLTVGVGAGRGRRALVALGSLGSLGERSQ